MFGKFAVFLVSFLLVGMEDELPDLPPLISLLSDEELEVFSTGNEICLTARSPPPNYSTLTGLFDSFALCVQFIRRKEMCFNAALR